MVYVADNIYNHCIALVINLKNSWFKRFKLTFLALLCITAWLHTDQNVLVASSVEIKIDKKESMLGRIRFYTIQAHFCYIRH